MPFDYVIDREAGIVFSTGIGAVTLAELTGHQDRLTSDPDFKPDFRQLVDLTKVDHFNTKLSDLHALAARNVFGPGSRRAIVANSELHFGMARGFELMRAALTKGENREEIMVFRDLAEARSWLGLE